MRLGSFRSHESVSAWPRVLNWAMVISALLFVSCQSSLAQNKNEPLGERKIVVESFVISGTRAVDSAELVEITSSMTGSTFNDDAEELRERIQAQFQDRGYFNVEIQKLDSKIIDPLASPKPVRLEAQVGEGTRCRLRVTILSTQKNCEQSSRSRSATSSRGRRSPQVWMPCAVSTVRGDS